MQKHEISLLIQSRYGHSKTTSTLLAMLCLADVKWIKPGESLKIKVGPGLRRTSCLTINGSLEGKAMEYEEDIAGSDICVRADYLTLVVVETHKRDLNFYFVTDTEVFAAYAETVLRHLFVNFSSPELVS